MLSTFLRQHYWAKRHLIGPNMFKIDLQTYIITDQQNILFMLALTRPGI